VLLHALGVHSKNHVSKTKVTQSWYKHFSPPACSQPLPGYVPPVSCGGLPARPCADHATILGARENLVLTEQLPIEKETGGA